MLLLNKKPSVLHIVAVITIFSIIAFAIHKHRLSVTANLKKMNCKISEKQFKESAFAHQLLDNLKGIEIGASSYNPFCLDSINVNYSNDTEAFRQEELRVTGTYTNVDVVAPGDKLPFANDSYDFVVNGHVIEHFYDPVKTVEEWFRVLKKGGLIFMIIPHKERTFDRIRNRTTLIELIRRHEKPDPNLMNDHGHHSVWITEDFVELCLHYNWKIFALQDTDDKDGIGFTIVLQKQ